VGPLELAPEPPGAAAPVPVPPLRSVEVVVGDVPLALVLGVLVPGAVVPLLAPPVDIVSVLELAAPVP
jgi:hypothetical protein